MQNNRDYDDENQSQDPADEATIQRNKEIKLIRRNIGSQSLRKGQVRDGIQIVAWDSIQDCVPDRCPIGHECEYASKSHSANGGGGKCALQTEYVSSFIAIVLRTYKYLDEADMFKVGMHLVPLYSQLCRQKLVERSLGDIMQVDNRGNSRVHPIYREIRDTLRTISSLWKDMGVTGTILPEVPEYKAREGFGDPSHYARLVAGAENKRNVVR